MCVVGIIVARLTVMILPFVLFVRIRDIRGSWFMIIFHLNLCMVVLQLHVVLNLKFILILH